MNKIIKTFAVIIFLTLSISQTYAGMTITTNTYKNASIVNFTEGQEIDVKEGKPVHIEGIAEIKKNENTEVSVNLNYQIPSIIDLKDNDESIIMDINNPLNEKLYNETLAITTHDEIIKYHRTNTGLVNSFSITDLNLTEEQSNIIWEEEKEGVGKFRSKSLEELKNLPVWEDINSDAKEKILYLWEISHALNYKVLPESNIYLNACSSYSRKENDKIEWFAKNEILNADWKDEEIKKLSVPSYITLMNDSEIKNTIISSNDAISTNWETFTSDDNCVLTVKVHDSFKQTFILIINNADDLHVTLDVEVTNDTNTKGFISQSELDKASGVSMPYLIESEDFKFSFERFRHLFPSSSSDSIVDATSTTQIAINKAKESYDIANADPNNNEKFNTYQMLRSSALMAINQLNMLKLMATTGSMVNNIDIIQVFNTMSSEIDAVPIINKSLNGPNGKEDIFSFEFTVSQPGLYEVKLLDSNRKPVTTGLHGFILHIPWLNIDKSKIIVLSQLNEDYRSETGVLFDGTQVQTNEEVEALQKHFNIKKIYSNALNLLKDNNYKSEENDEGLIDISSSRYLLNKNILKEKFLKNSKTGKIEDQNLAFYILNETKTGDDKKSHFIITAGQEIFVTDNGEKFSFPISKNKFLNLANESVIIPSDAQTGKFSTDLISKYPILPINVSYSLEAFYKTPLKTLSNQNTLQIASTDEYSIFLVQTFPKPVNIIDSQFDPPIPPPPAPPPEISAVSVSYTDECVGEGETRRTYTITCRPSPCTDAQISEAKSKFK